MQDILHVQNVVSVVILAAMAICDTKRKVLPGFVVIPFIFTGIITGVIYKSFEELILSCLPGILLLVMGLLTNEKIGFGDGLMTLGLGLWVRIGLLNIGIVVGMLLLGLFAVFILIYFRLMHRDTNGVRIPFIPFLLTGLLVGMAYA